MIKARKETTSYVGNAANDTDLERGELKQESLRPISGFNLTFHREATVAGGKAGQNNFDDCHVIAKAFYIKLYVHLRSIFLYTLY